ncbi:2212_t:CDS:1 [Paraglomus occultum]|uniref:2212_t:CDS:1 n=1 Tax=Paraglomus occultum TaxID=144539 RepID=A0A9N8ZS43_9GLOM|nr:2212_t:CDS:1 [Paraglomus occultum]
MEKKESNMHKLPAFMTFFQDDDSDHNNEEDLPPEETLKFILNNQRSWILPSRQNIYKYIHKCDGSQKEERLSAVEKAVLCYGLSQIIDLSAHMKQWFSLKDRRFMMKDYMSLLQVPCLNDKETSFVTTIKNVHKYTC